MPKEKTISKSLEEIVNKVDDLIWLWRWLSSSTFDFDIDNITAAMNCIERLLLDIENDIVNVQEVIYKKENAIIIVL